MWGKHKLITMTYGYKKGSVLRQKGGEIASNGMEQLRGDMVGIGINKLILEWATRRVKT